MRLTDSFGNLTPPFEIATKVIAFVISIPLALAAGVLVMYAGYLLGVR